MSGSGPDTWRKAGCCGGEREEIVQIGIGDDAIGLIALNEIFEQLYTLGRRPDTSVENELLKMVAAKNYVPPKAEDEYRSALVREYARFCAKKQERRGNG